MNCDRGWGGLSGSSRREIQLFLLQISANIYGYIVKLSGPCRGVIAHPGQVLISINGDFVVRFGPRGIYSDLVNYDTGLVHFKCQFMPACTVCLELIFHGLVIPEHVPFPVLASAPGIQRKKFQSLLVCPGSELLVKIVGVGRQAPDLDLIVSGPGYLEPVGKGRLVPPAPRA
jgi:hypothetical protein